MCDADARGAKPSFEKLSLSFSLALFVRRWEVLMKAAEEFRTNVYFYVFTA